MKEIKALIVDDEAAARDVLKNLLNRVSSIIKVVDEAFDLTDAVAKIKKLKPDVVFLDVQMPNYAGYEIASFFDKIDFEIIFVTAFDQYAIKAFELSAVDYLVKPINRLRLKEAIEKLEGKIDYKDVAENYEVLLETLKGKQLGKMIISELGGKHIIQLQDIVAIEAQGAYSNIHLQNGKSLLVSKNLKHFESTLPEHQIFFRSHKSWIVNLEKIEQFYKSKGEIQLTNDVIARLSKYRIAEFTEATQTLNA